MLDEQDGKVKLLPDLPDEFGQLHRFLRVHAGGRLIQNKQPRVGRQRTGDLQTALLAVGQVGGGFVLQLRQPHDLQKLHRLPAHPSLLPAVQVEGRR